MSRLTISKDCLIDKTSKAILRAFQTNQFIIGADKRTPLFDKASDIILENVFHYNKKTKMLETYLIHSDPNSERYNLEFELAFNVDDFKSKFSKHFLSEVLNHYDYLFFDKHQNLNTISFN